MNLSEEVDLEDYVARPDKISGADINAICQEVTVTIFQNETNIPCYSSPLLTLKEKTLIKIS